MITDPSQLSSLVNQLAASTWTLAAIATVFESGLADALSESRTLDELAERVPSLPRERILRCLDVVAARGLVIADGGRYKLAPGALAFARPPMRTDLLGDIRSTLMQSLEFVDASTQPTPVRGWYHTNPRLLQAQGDSSVGFASALAGKLGAALDGLDARLAAPGARFLDVGVGVAALSIAMCRAFPALHVVGLDVFDIPLSIARENVKRAELDHRIELRQLAIEDLREEGTFDLVWLPVFFLTPSSVPAAIARARAALAPGGWLLIPTLDATATDELRRVFALVSESWGMVPESTAIAGLATDAGFAPRSLPGPGCIVLVAGQR